MVNKLKEFLASCALVYIHGSPKTVENCVLYINNAKSELVLKDAAIEAYLFELPYSAQQHTHH